MAVSDTMDVEKITDKSDHCGKITGIDLSLIHICHLS